MEIGEDPSALELRVAARLKSLRAKYDFTLDELAKRSGVSRSMISSIERAESSPTARVLDKLAASLEVSLAALFADEDRADADPVSRHAEQPTWRDPETGYVRRNLSPAVASPLNLVEVILPPRTRVAYDSGPRVAEIYHQVWVIEGTLEVTAGSDVYSLDTGDCFAVRIGQSMAYCNPTLEGARYILATTTGEISPTSSRVSGTNFR